MCDAPKNTGRKGRSVMQGAGWKNNAVTGVIKTIASAAQDGAVDLKELNGQMAKLRPRRPCPCRGRRPLAWCEAFCVLCHRPPRLTRHGPVMAWLGGGWAHEGCRAELAACFGICEQASDRWAARMAPHRLSRPTRVMLAMAAVMGLALTNQ